MEKQQAVQDAAQAVIQHGGPDCLTDPHIPLEAMNRALEAGASHHEIAAEIRRQRGT